MRKLLSADFSRAFKSRVFWISEFLMLLCSLLVMTMLLQTSSEITVYSGSLFLYTIAAPIVASVLVPLLIGKETANGALRNKLIVGHTKSAVYGSHLIVSSVISLLLELGFFLPYLIGVLLTSKPDHDGWMLLLKTIPCSFLIPVVFSSLFVLICLLIKNRSLSAAGCVLTAFLVFFAGMYIKIRLQEEEFITYAYWSMVNENGEEIDFQDMPESGTVTEKRTEVERKPNPNYLRGTKRKVFEFLFDFTPGGQMIQLSMLDTDRLGQKSGYSLLLFAAVTGAGILCFRKKNLE